MTKSIATKLQKEILRDMINGYSLKYHSHTFGKDFIRCAGRKISYTTFSSLREKKLIQAIPEEGYQEVKIWELTVIGKNLIK